MKKSILAVAGLAAVAGVVAPMGAAFAEGNYHAYKDTISVTIAAECSVEDGSDNIEGTSPVVSAFSADMALSTTQEFTGADATGTDAATGFSIVCNDNTATWTLTAIGAGAENHTTDLWDGTHAIATATGEPTITSSAWAFKMTGSTTTGLTLSKTSWSAIPSTAETVATGTGAKEFDRSYKISVDDSQEPGTYNGAVLYQLSNAN